MCLSISERELAAVTELDAEARYKYFIKRVADWEQAWGLYEDGWVTTVANAGCDKPGLALWPARRYAETWGGHNRPLAEARVIALEALLGEWIPMLRASLKSLVVFPVTGSDDCIHRTPGGFLADLETELEQYQ